MQCTSHTHTHTPQGGNNIDIIAICHPEPIVLLLSHLRLSSTMKRLFQISSATWVVISGGTGRQGTCSHNSVLDQPYMCMIFNIAF